VALFYSLLEAAPKIGFVLSVAHLHHHIRGKDADEDARFVADLASQSGLVLHRGDADVPATAAANRETLEEAARNLRYAWFQQLLASGEVDAIATAHTLDDQAETVLHKLLRGAWTEGLGAIHPVITYPRGQILRPFLSTRRVTIEAWLKGIGQPWREDETNSDTTYTRNRIRHELLPVLESYNPQVRTQLANLATLARDEDAWWQAEMARIAPPLLLPGKPVRGGGRSASTHPEEASIAVEIERLPRSVAIRRRLLRMAAKQLGTTLNFEQTERLLTMLGPGATRRQTLTASLSAERSSRELRLIRNGPKSAKF
jgi:tRNA(Ile)-lysidine synthase